MEYPPVGEAGGEWDKSCEGIKQGDAPRRGTGQGTRHDEEPGRGRATTRNRVGDAPRRGTGQGTRHDEEPGRGRTTTRNQVGTLHDEKPGGNNKEPGRGRTPTRNQVGKALLWKHIHMWVEGTTRLEHQETLTWALTRLSGS